ncbi:MAG: hypothetical protein KAT05_17070, partial [Spirochaetes bacterium]|nr:hypothetical protein [Spirochaetota bacterium]
MKNILNAIKRNIYLKNDKQCTLRLLNKIPKLDIHEATKIFFFSSTNIDYYNRLYLLFGYELAKRGIPSCFLFENELISPHFPLFEVDNYQISNSLLVNKRRIHFISKKSQKNIFDWNVDLKREKILAEELNFFPLIRSNLRSFHKSYNIDFSDPINIKFMNRLIESCDLLLKYFFLLQTYALKNEINIRIVGREPSYIPDGLFKTVCSKFSINREIEYIDLGRGYMHYFGLPMVSSYVAVTNSTKNNGIGRLVITNDEFKKFREKQINKKKMTVAIDKVLMNRQKRGKSKNKKQVVKRISEYL